MTCSFSEQNVLWLYAYFQPATWLGCDNSGKFLPQNQHQPKRSVPESVGDVIGIGVDRGRSNAAK